MYDFSEKFHGELHMEVMFAYGAFGYGYSSQLCR
jgi:hypothetical protein